MTPSGRSRKGADTACTSARKAHSILGTSRTTGPHFSNFDLGLYKNFPFREGKNSVQFRAEFFNAFNVHDFGSYGGGGINSGCCESNNNSFGDTTSSTQQNARIIQFALKVYF